MLKFIVFSLAIASAIGQSTPGSATFSNPTKSSGITGTAVQYTQGIQVTLSGTGFYTSDALNDLYTTANKVVTEYITLVSNTGDVGLGITALGGTGACTDALFTSEHVTPATMLARATGSCPSDFASVYTATQSTSQTTTTVKSATPVPAAGKTVKYTITAPAVVGSSATGCNILVYAPPGASSGVGSDITALNTAGTCASTPSSSSAQEGYFVATKKYAFYVETLGTSSPAAVVCFQNSDQFTASPGNCGTAVPTTTTNAVTFSNPTILQASGANVGKAQTYTQGVLVTLTAPGYVTSDAMTSLFTTTGVSYTAYTTLVSATGASVGIGITAIGGGCTAFSTEHATTMLAKATSTCPSDFLTVYSATTPGTSTSSTVVKTTNIDTANAKTAKWLIISPSAVGASSSKCNTLSYTAPGTTVAKADLNPSGTCATTPASNQEGYFVATKSYAFYVELQASGTAASVCFQSAAQYSANPGACGTAVTSTSTSSSSSSSSTSSASMVSAIMAPIVLAILMFFN